MTNDLAQLIGYGAQTLFGTRFFVQLWKSEKAGKVESPSIFWQVSLLASLLLLIYSILVKDIPIMLGQLLGYFIYIRNLMLEKVWRQFHPLLRLFIIAIPAIAVVIIFGGPKHDLIDFAENNSNPCLLIWGLTGQAVFTSRFVYQWLYSEIKKESVFPTGFWIISIAGALLISSYAFYLHLYPIIIGHAIGMLVYVRNLMIHFNFLTRKSNSTVKHPS